MKSVKTGGRQKGTPNKLTANIKEHITDILEGYTKDQMLSDWSELKPKERLEMLHKLGQYIMPKPKPDAPQTDTTIEWNEVKTYVFVPASHGDKEVSEETGTYRQIN